MTDMFIFGLGYSASMIAAHLRGMGWRVTGTGGAEGLRFDDEPAVRAHIASASHVLSSVPPAGESDPVLARYGDALGRLESNAGWLGYLSSTGVYGDTGGAWVDESAPIGGGRRAARSVADADWLARGAHVFRLPGIYGFGRSAFDRLQAGKAHRVDLPRQVFSRVHVEDIVGGVIAALDAPPGAYNLADDLPCSQNALLEEACRLIGREPPPLVRPDDPALSPMQRAFYAENRRVANGKARRVLGWRPRYSTYREGLRAILAGERPQPHIERGRNPA